MFMRLKVFLFGVKRWVICDNIWITFGAFGAAFNMLAHASRIAHDTALGHAIQQRKGREETRNARILIDRSTAIAIEPEQRRNTSAD